MLFVLIRGGRFFSPSSLFGWVRMLIASSDHERSEQVALMARIYTLCTQVVVYLGPDVTPVLPSGRYPRRMRLSEFEKAPGKERIKVRELLQRRYFSRLWVVQELILSPRVVICVDDIDFYSDGATSGDLWTSEAADLAPWVRHMSKGTPLDLDLLQVMRLTSPTICADPRDRLFGVMGTVSDASWHLDAEYSIPVQHVFLGLFARLLMEKGMVHLLSCGSGPAGPPSVPSWVPSVASWDEWRRVFEQPTRNTRRVLRSSFVVIVKKKPWKDTIATIGLPLKYGPLGAPCHGTIPADEKPGKRFQALHLVGSARHDTALLGVDRMTGALRARMARLLALNSAPEPVAALEGDRSLTLFQVRYGYDTLYMASEQRLDTLVELGSDYLYMFPLQDKDRAPAICILRMARSTPSIGSASALRLVASCEAAFFHKQNISPPPFRSVILLRAAYMLTYPRWEGLGPVEGLDSRMYVGKLTWRLCEVIERTQAWLDSDFNPDERLVFGPTPGLTRRDCLPLYWAFVPYPADQASTSTKTK